MTILAPARPDLIIRHPANREPLPVQGREVELDSYWRRRIADGDVVLVAPEPAPKTKTKAE